MSFSRESIIADIRRTAAENGGVPLGQKAFERDTGISASLWRGRYWRNWGDALIEAGFAPNQPNKAHEKLHLIRSLALLTRKNGFFPTYADVRIEKARNKDFPGHHSFTRLGTPEQRVALVRQYATNNSEFSDILRLLPSDSALERDISGDTSAHLKEGFVYMGLLRVGAEKRYKIGSTNLVERRQDQVAVQLPEDLELVHEIKTDDAYGIEAYWHKRFASKRTKGEWFSLSRDEVQAFKKRKFM